MGHKEVTQINSLAIKMLITGVEAHKDVNLLREMKAITGFDFANAPSISKYEHYLSVVDFLCERVFPDKPVDEACEWMGYRMAKQYIENPVGKVLAMAGAVVGAKRGSKFFLKAIENFIPEVRHEYEEHTDNYSRYRYYNLRGSPAVMAGIHRLALELISAKNIKVTFSVISPTEAIFENRWN
jgi:uncharacterized protein (TIGR02265 family)